ncbi:hypothetical protein [Actinomadura sp. NPDC048394]|uniref:hypothetical protein n=1 Tax=Actinomadura sp. NPDC048394 TaxID=3158223 RepID=UPI0033DE78E8
MPNTTGGHPHGYDPGTDTVRVRRYDLWRLLLAFRDLTERQAPRTWSHMLDYDISFERLADAVDAANQTLSGPEWRGPDYRMRCSLAAAYVWPEDAPYDAGRVTAVRVVGYGSHYVADLLGPELRALCGLGYAAEEGKTITGEPTCPECRRELALMQLLRSGTERHREHRDTGA